MAESQLAGHNPLVDLLLSPRAAFIWDGTGRAVTWMNQAARAKFGLGLEDFQRSLPAALTRRFSQCTGKGKSARRIVKVKIAGHPVLNCSIEALELAGGHRGLIVAGEDVAPAGGSRPAPPPAKPMRKPPDAPKRVASPKGELELNEVSTPSPRLTPEEERSFKAIGRIVRRLCKDKERAQARSPEGPAPARSPVEKASAGPAPALLFSAFDLVLFLDWNFSIVASQGRPQRLGWRKSSLQGKSAAQLFLAPEQPVFHRMANKLSVTGSQLCRGTLVACDGSETGLACRAILGHWTSNGAGYFLALLSLIMPARLRKHWPVASIPDKTRLAA